MSAISTPLTEQFGIKHPIFLAGMNVAAGPRLAAAVTNAGGLGVIGGLGYTADMLREVIREVKAGLNDKNAPFGVDLLLPKLGVGARATNYDYTKGKLHELVAVIIEQGAKLFVSAVGVPPKFVIDELHRAGIPVMNMIGHPKHVLPALAAGVDIICAQGSEGGGHTGDVATSILIPEVVRLCEGKKSPLTGKAVYVVAAGGIYNGKSLAAALMYGAQAVWVGTRFICATEAGAPRAHQDAVIGASYSDTIRTIIYTGRPLRVLNNEYIQDWETKRRDEIAKLTKAGKIPVVHEIEESEKLDGELQGKLGSNKQFDMDDYSWPWLMGQVAGAVREVKSAKEIMDEMIREAVDQLRQGHQMIGSHSRL